MVSIFSVFMNLCTELLDFVAKYIVEIIIGSFFVSLIIHFIIEPYIKYQNLKEELSKVLYKNALVAHNIRLSQQSYNDTYDELRRIGGEITGFINRTKLEIIMRFLKIPNKNELNEAVGLLNRVMNSLNRPNMMTLIFQDYQRIKEIFKIQ